MHELESVVITLRNGSRTAQATLHRHTNGWVVHRIVEPGSPVINGPGGTYPTREEAEKVAYAELGW